MEKLSLKEMDYMALPEGRKVYADKALFLSQYKNEIISSLPSIGYLIFKTLISDKPLEELNEYNMIMDYIKNQKNSLSGFGNGDEKDIITIIGSIADRIATSYEEKMSIRNYLNKYDEFFEKEKVKTNIISA